jgi:uncharacterized MnhB-related membrane protein
LYAEFIEGGVRMNTIILVGAVGVMITLLGWLMPAPVVAVKQKGVQHENRRL